MKPYISVVCAKLGIGLVFTSTLACILTLVQGVVAAGQLMASPGSDRAQLAAVIGETIIAFTCRGIIAVIPAILIYLAISPFQQRAHWFQSCARLAGYCLLFMFPFGTLCGIILLVMLHRRRFEFGRDESLSGNPAEPHG